MFSKTSPKYLFQWVPPFWLVCCLCYHLRAYLNTICIKNYFFLQFDMYYEAVAQIAQTPYIFESCIKPGLFG